MSRDYKVYLEDVLEAIRKIREFTAGLTLDTFSRDAKPSMRWFETLKSLERRLNTFG